MGKFSSQEIESQYDLIKMLLADWLVFYCFYDNRGRIFKFCLLIDLRIKIKEITD